MSWLVVSTPLKNAPRAGTDTLQPWRFEALRPSISFCLFFSVTASQERATVCSDIAFLTAWHASPQCAHTTVPTRLLEQPTCVMNAPSQACIRR